MKKLVFVSFFALFFVTAIYSQTVKVNNGSNASWRMLDKAELEYDNGNLGEALKFAENAKSLRRTEYQKAVSALEDATKPVVAQRAGDLIEDVYPLLKERMELEAVNYIDLAVSRFGAEYFKSSVQNIKNYYRDHIVYPEADYLIGKIFLSEGELDVAENYFDNALKNWQFLDIQSTKYYILYDLAYLYSIKGDETGYEQSLLNIVKDNDDYLVNGEISSSLKSILRYAQKEKSPDKFFKLYRAGNYFSIKACLKLADFYYEKNSPEKARYQSVLGVLSSFTRMNEILVMRNSKYAYNDLHSFFEEALRHSDVRDWIDDNNVWNGFYTFALLMEEGGNKEFASSIYQILSELSLDPYVKNLSNTKNITVKS